MRNSKERFSRESILLGCLAVLAGLVAFGAPSSSHAGIQLTRSVQPLILIHGLRAVPATVALVTLPQDPGQAVPAAPAAAPVAPKPVVLPDGEGKAIATEFCQDCHRLTNLVRAHKDLDDWKDTIHTMMDRGARITDDKIDPLAQYLFANFGPKPAGADANASATAAATAPPAAAAPATDAAPSASAAAAVPAAAAKAVVELPEGDGKAIATENCQACHKLTNLTKAHKSLDDWKDTVQTMMDRGANVPPDKVDILVQYLAKNFGPKDESAPSPAAPAPAN